MKVNCKTGKRLFWLPLMPKRNPSLKLFRMINECTFEPSNFLGDFNSKQFACVKPNKSGQTLIVNIAKDLKLFYVNQLCPNRHTCEDPKYVSARLIHEASGLPYVRERLVTVGQNHLARMHANPLVEQTINSFRTNIAWDKYKTPPISILNPPD